MKFRTKKYLNVYFISKRLALFDKFEYTIVVNRLGNNIPEHFHFFSLF